MSKSKKTMFVEVNEFTISVVPTNDYAIEVGMEGDFGSTKMLIYGPSPEDLENLAEMFSDAAKNLRREIEKEETGKWSK